MPIKIFAMRQKTYIITVIDGCQAAPHIPIDLQELGCDFYVFLGTNYSPSGIGVLYGKKYVRRFRHINRRRND